MASSPPSNPNDPSARFSFDDVPPQPPVFGVSGTPYQPQRQNTSDDTESLGDDIVEAVDDTLGISNRLIGCSIWLFLLPFRIIWKIIVFLTDWL